MKKKNIIMLIIICIFIIEAIAMVLYIDKKKDRTPEYLFNQYVKAYQKADEKAAKDIYPPYYIESAKKYLSAKYLKAYVKSATERYGDGFKITYEITKKTKLNDKELNDLNKNIASTFKAKEKAKECYKLDGATIYEGSKGKERSSFHNINYCKYKITWYLVIDY